MRPNRMRTPRTMLACLVILTAAAERPARADGFIVPIPMPGPVRERIVPPAVKYHRVQVKIRGRLATTFIDQVFVNPNRRALEGEYLFPIPERAAIRRFTLDIDGKTVEGEVLDAEKARRIYEDIVRRLKDPALLEYSGRDLFRARVFPIPPGGERRITLTYEEAVPSEGNLFVYRYPLNTERFSSRPIEEVEVKVTLGGSRPVGSLVVASHPGEAQVRRAPDAAEVSLKQRNVLPDKDFVLYYTLGGKLGLDLLAHREISEDGYFMLAISPPQRGRERRAKDLVFAVDTSGSMAGEKLEQVKAALKYCLNSLGEEDRFNIVGFGTEARSFKSGLVQANRAEIAAALRFVDGLRARGGTNVEEALDMALGIVSDDTLGILGEEAPGEARGRPAFLAFLTDGKPTIGERRPEQLVKRTAGRNRRRARIFVFGVGEDLNTRLLDRLAELGRGARSYIAPEEDVELAVTSFYDKIAYPVLTEVEIEFDPALGVREVYPKHVPDLFHGSEAVLFGRYTGSGAGSLMLSGTTARGRREVGFEVGFPERADNGLVSRLWAVRKIGYLLDEIRLHGEDEELKAEVVRLAKLFGIMTPYTSMLVLEDEEGRPGRRPGPVPLPARVFKRRALDEAKQAFEAPAGPRSVSASREIEGMKDGRFSLEKAAEDALGGRAKEMVRHLEDKTFYERDGVLWDSAYDGKAERIKVIYLSEKYFELTRQRPKLGRYFALGARVVVVFEGKTYEVVEEG